MFLFVLARFRLANNAGTVLLKVIKYRFVTKSPLVAPDRHEKNVEFAHAIVPYVKVLLWEEYIRWSSEEERKAFHVALSRLLRHVRLDFSQREIDFVFIDVCAELSADVF